jgi:hypothetical protein
MVSGDPEQGVCWPACFFAPLLPVLHLAQAGLDDIRGHPFIHYEAHLSSACPTQRYAKGADAPQVKSPCQDVIRIKCIDRRQFCMIRARMFLYGLLDSRMISPADTYSSATCSTILPAPCAP